MTETETHPEAGAIEACCCYCGETLEAGEQVCSQCGRQQMRMCFCGVPMAADALQCPHCGAPWAGAGRSRRRHRTVRLRSVDLARSAAVGAVATVLVSGLLNLLISAMAQRSAPDGNIPESVLLRLRYAWHTLTATFGESLSWASGLGLGPVLVAALIGAAGGCVWYLFGVGWVRRARNSRRGRRRHPSRRRERTT